MPADPSLPDSGVTAAPLPIAVDQRGTVEALVFSATVFLGAFLLFLIEPLIAKAILPWFGGSAAVWATCLVFFQSALLLGYLYADVVSRRIPPRLRTLLHIVLLLACVLLLPIAPRASWRSRAGNDPAWAILGLLTTSIGLPFLLLSTTSPLVQTWYARRRPGREPYHLFALSNLASLLALLSYPFLIEPRLAGHSQLQIWSLLFALFIAVCIAAAWIGRSAATAPAAEWSEASQPPDLRSRLLWLGLSTCGSMLLLSITNHLTQNVAPVPLLWVLPLAFYLLTFALAFHRRSLYSRPLVVPLFAAILGALGYAVYDPDFTHSLQVSVPLFCGGLFVCCLFCHGELYRLKPAARQLTSYYLMIALGGALGAVFVGLFAPHLFRNLYEFPLTLLLTALLALAVLWSAGWLARIGWAAAAVALGVVLVLNIRSRQEDSLVMVRNFYGALRVTETTENEQRVRTLYNGTIDHGEQVLSPEMRLKPISYYGPDSGISLALRHCCSGPRRVGVIGLGTGTIAAFGKPGDSFRFYEINPQVMQIARNSFTYLRETPATIEVILGDARLMLEREPSQQFDVLAVDAFSGDAIPVHLLTREAMALYLRHLKPQGILAVHTSNLYLDLPLVVQQLAGSFGWTARLISSDEDEDNFLSSSDWVLVTRNRNFLSLDDVTATGETIRVPPALRPWTDDYNNLFQILKPTNLLKKDN